MIQTEIGSFHILVDDQELAYSARKLRTHDGTFNVDARYQVSIPVCGKKIELLLKIEDMTGVDSGPETGQDLSLINFVHDTTKISIGTEGDIEGIRYEYLENGIRLWIGESCEKKGLKINIAWLKMKIFDENNVSCWFAADPTLPD